MTDGIITLTKEETERFGAYCKQRAYEVTANAKTILKNGGNADVIKQMSMLVEAHVILYRELTKKELLL